MRSLISVSFLFLLTYSAQAQAQALEESVKFVQNFKTYQTSLPRENIFIHTDRELYTRNDQIWLSAYVVAGGMNFLSDISKVLYVELIAPSGEIEKRINLKIENGRSEGYIPLTDFSEGTYKIKAYTLWSKNFDSNYTFEKSIIISSGESTSEIPNSANQAIDLQFMPEGGDLISGIESQIAFKAVNPDGFGVSVSGEVYNQKDELITSFKSVHDGMGIFKLTPSTNDEYYAVLNNQKYTLPRAKKSGYRLSINKSDNLIIAQIQQSKDLQTSENLLLFGHVRGEIFYASPVKLSDHKSTLTVTQETFPTGVIHFTLLLSDTPIAERLVFNKNESDKIAVRIKTDDESFPFRSRVETNFQIGTNSDSDSATASVTVFDTNLGGYNPLKSNVQTKLYFENNVRGRVENPAFYLQDTPESEKYLDLLLLSQGWRTYDMNYLANTDEVILDISPEKGFTVSGTVKRVIGRKPLKNASVMLIPGVDMDKAKFSISDDEGRFSFSGLDIEGEKLITLKVQHPNKGTRVHISLDEQYENFVSSYSEVYQKDVSQFLINKSSNKVSELTSRSENNTENYSATYDFEMSGEFDQITVEAKKVSDNYVDQVLGSELQGTGTQVDLDEQDHLKSLPVDIILNQIPGVTANASTRNIYVETGFRSFGSGKLPPLIFIDGVQVDNQSLLSLNSSEIKSITVARSNSDLTLFGSEGAGGAIMITTREPGTFEIAKPGTLTEYLTAFQEKATFYTPKYGVNIPSDLEQKDTRFTLHWDPLLDFENNESETVFWTNDVPSEYVIEIQGITDDGIPFYNSKVFTVK